MRFPRSSRGLPVFIDPVAGQSHTDDGRGEMYPELNCNHPVEVVVSRLDDAGE
jgi:hypothetical protein